VGMVHAKIVKGGPPAREDLKVSARTLHSFRSFLIHDL
jgi:hypothetical protein